MTQRKYWNDASIGGGKWTLKAIFGVFLHKQTVRTSISLSGVSGLCFVYIGGKVPQKISMDDFLMASFSIF